MSDFVSTDLRPKRRIQFDLDLEALQDEMSLNSLELREAVQKILVEDEVLDQVMRQVHS